VRCFLGSRLRYAERYLRYEFNTSERFGQRSAGVIHRSKPELSRASRMRSPYGVCIQPAPEKPKPSKADAGNHTIRIGDRLYFVSHFTGSPNTLAHARGSPRPRQPRPQVNLRPKAKAGGGNQARSNRERSLRRHPAAGTGERLSRDTQNFSRTDNYQPLCRRCAVVPQLPSFESGPRRSRCPEFPNLSSLRPPAPPPPEQAQSVTRHRQRSTGARRPVVSNMKRR